MPTMKRVVSAPQLHPRFGTQSFQMRVEKINDLGPLLEHKEYGTESPQVVRTPSNESDKYGTEPTDDEDYGFYDAIDGNQEDSERSSTTSSLQDEIQNSTPSAEIASGRPSRRRSSGKKSSLKQRSSYGEDFIPLDFERKEFNRVLPKPDLSQRTRVPEGESTEKANGMIRSSSSGLFRVVSEPILFRPIYQEQFDIDDLSSNNEGGRLENSDASNSDGNALDNSDSSFVEGAMKKRISFGTIQIREHSVTIGDNPSCSYGAPIQLDWKHEDMEDLKVEDYEAYRPKTRTKDKLYLSHFKRMDLLKQSGHSTSEIKESRRKTKKHRNQREWTKFVVMNYPTVSTMEDAIESGIRKMKRSLSKSSLGSKEDIPRVSSKDDMNVIRDKALLLDMIDNDGSNATAPF